VPDFAEALNNKGLALLDLKDQSAAFEKVRHAARLDPANAAAHYNAAGIHWQRGDYAAAAEAHRHCLNAAPNHLSVLNDLGLTEAALGNHTAALACYDRALRLTPDFSEAQFNKSLTCLLLGNLEEDWHLWEARKRKKIPVGSQDFGLPLWTGRRMWPGGASCFIGNRGLAIRFNLFVMRRCFRLRALMLLSWCSLNWRLSSAA